MQRRRPIGVTIIAILIILGGVIWGLLSMFELLSVTMIEVGLASFALAHGLLKGKRWGYWLTVIFTFVGMTFGFLSIIFLPTLGGGGAIILLINLFPSST